MIGRFLARQQDEGTLLAREVEEMEQGRLIALGTIHVLDRQGSVRNQVWNLPGRDLEGIDGPGMSARGPDRRQMALAAASRDR